jgi:hypothetical protein
MPGPVWRAYALPKRGHSAGEYEDAWAAGPDAGRFAVADGASESSFAGAWSRQLVEAFVDPGTEAADAGWLAEPQRRWAEEVDPLSLPWYAEEKRDAGAFAAFCGLHLLPGGEDGGGAWHAVAVGDSCCFQIRGGELAAAFPVERAADFGNVPALVGSRPPALAAYDRQRVERRGDWRPGESFLLMTDALAQWFLAEHEAGMKPWGAVERLSGEGEAFAAWVEGLRARGGLRNDDVTLVVLTV